MQFGPFGLPELLVILALALLVFGPRKLPEMGRALGRALGEFRKGAHDLKRTLEADLRDVEDAAKDAAGLKDDPSASYPPPDEPKPAGKNDAGES
jgi:TatA/E family protein of Tat protein translocase